MESIALGDTLEALTPSPREAEVRGFLRTYGYRCSLTGILYVMDEELEVFDQARIDKTIWRHIGRKPVAEIAKMAGMHPNEVLRRKNELLESVDVLTIQEKRTRLMVELEEIGADARDRFKNASDEFAAGLLNSSVAAMKTVLGELARAEKADQGALERLNELRLRELLRLMDRVVISSTKEIAAKYELSEDELQEVFQEKLVEEAREMDAQ